MAKEAKPKGSKTKSDGSFNKSPPKPKVKVKIPSPSTSPESSPCPSPIDDELITDLLPAAEVGKNEEAADWPKEDDMELFDRIQKSLPTDDTMKYDSRLNHVIWETVAFGEYSAEDCKTRWLFVQGHLRRYRVLSEMIGDAISWRIRPWTNFNASRKSQNHPDHPKKPLSSYMLYYMDKKSEVLDKLPGLAMTDLSKIIAKQYHELTEKKKSKYTDLALIEKEKYDIKLKKFLQDHPEYLASKLHHSAKPVPPKVPTPFKLYSDAKASKFMQEGLNALEAKEKCRETFKELTDRQRIKWIYKAFQQEAQYNEDIEKFKQENPDVAVVKKTVLSKEEQLLKDKTEGKPIKPPNSGYSLFSQQLLMSDELKNFMSKDRMSQISRKWKELSDEEKSKYNLGAKELMHTYKMEYATYLESLQPEQREAELIRTHAKGAKRANTQPNTKNQPEEKKPKTEKDSNSENLESDSDKEFQKPKKTIKKTIQIQKPNSSLQMFCDVNFEKYKKKHANLSQFELTRLMAKAFSKLSVQNKVIYEIMATQSKEVDPQPEASQSRKESPQPETSKPVKKSKKVPAKSAAAESPEPPTKKAGKKSKANAKEDNLEVPRWVCKTPLYKNEPPKPPENVADFYSCLSQNESTLSQASLEEQWDSLPKKEKSKYTEMHKKELKDYAKNFENFVRTLPTGELKSFRAFMRDRKKREETGNHDDGEGEDEERLDDTVALRLSEEHGEEKSSDEDIAEVEDNTSVDSSEEEE